MIKAPPCLGELEQECSLQDQRVTIFAVLSLLSMVVLKAAKRAIHLEHHMNNFVFNSFQLVLKDSIFLNHLLDHFMLMELHTFLLKPKRSCFLYPIDTFEAKSFVFDFVLTMA